MNWGRPQISDDPVAEDEAAAGDETTCDQRALPLHGPDERTWSKVPSAKAIRGRGEGHPVREAPHLSCVAMYVGASKLPLREVDDVRRAVDEGRAQRASEP